MWSNSVVSNFDVTDSIRMDAISEHGAGMPSEFGDDNDLSGGSSAKRNLLLFSHTGSYMSKKNPEIDWN